MTPTVSASRFRPLKHAALAALAVGVVGALLAGMDLFGDPDKVGKASGQMIFWVFLTVLGASAAHQAGHRWVAVVCGALAAGSILLIVGLWARAALRKSDGPAKMTAEEQQSLKLSVDGRRLCSSSLGFSLPAQPDFVPTPEVQAQLNQVLAAQDAFSWVYTHPSTGERLIVIAVKGLSSREASFRDCARGVSASIQKQSQFKETQKSLTWSHAQGEFLLSLQSAEGIFLDFRCIATADSGHNPPLIACAETVAGSAEALANVRTGLTLSGC